MTNLRIGHGYDVHRLKPGRRLVLGGVEISWEKGLLGHSDADVLTHAVMDALAGAARLGDIGKLFPDTDPSYAGISSLKLLEKVGHFLRERGFSVVNRPRKSRPTRTEWRRTWLQLLAWTQNRST